ncbi:choloylglycine hydrolase family protein [Shewanella sp. Isolate13]|uniref:linear amide C-N hydrolase n=1 Tax=Shewanella sp. Isolate13 TaxID=2908531 RepID=UPI001EFD3040|nr:choloylglycine hydrolase family protein [Shewanella sp. Isolate13]MCG9731116.1 choloylglycine hydrolase family protein [Shewanella sp. Isolate13]
MTLFKVLVLVLLLSVSSFASACTSFILKTVDNLPVYGRTLEWGAFDLHSNLLVVPRNQNYTSDLGKGIQGMSWKNKYGFVAINALDQPFVLDGMNEKGLTLGALYFPDFAEYQKQEDKYRSVSVNNIDFSSYILGNFERVEEVSAALQKIRVVSNVELEKIFGAPTDLHFVVTDKSGSSIVIEYTNGKLNIYDNTVGVMTNAPSYDWHLLNIRNYSQLSPFAQSEQIKVGNIMLKPFGQGSGMQGIPGDSTPPSRFIRALAFKSSIIPLKTTDEAINEASRVLNNFDIPKGVSREGDKENFHMDYTQWSVIGDIDNLHYYWWTENNRRMRMIDLNKLDFDAANIIKVPLDKNKEQDVLEINLSNTSHN